MSRREGDAQVGCEGASRVTSGAPANGGSRRRSPVEMWQKDEQPDASPSLEHKRAPVGQHELAGAGQAGGPDPVST